LATTPNRAYPYPALSAVPDVPADLSALALAIDTDVKNTDVRLTDLFARRTTDSTAVSNSTTLVSDSQLVLTPAISTVYRLEGFIAYISTAVADLKWAFNFPAAATLSWGAVGNAITASSGAGDAVTNVANRLVADSTFSYGGGGAFICGLYLRGLLIMGGTAGNLTSRWAQATAEVSNTKILTDSWISLRKAA
jgi:hypothetical protein